MQNVKLNNIYPGGLFIQRADIEADTKDGSNNFIVTLKRDSSQRYLISIRSKTGLEAARIFLSKDTILVNDRINRKLYYGSSDYLFRRFGIRFNLLPLLFGDFLSDGVIDDNSGNCKAGKLQVKCQVGGHKIQYMIDCKRLKVTNTYTEGNFGKVSLEMGFSKFLSMNNHEIAKNIVIKDIKSQSSIKVSIRKVILPWNGIIEFIPGNNYEHIELL